MPKLASVVTVLRRRGPSYLGYLLTGYLVPRIGYRLAQGPVGRLLRRGQRPSSNRSLHRARDLQTRAPGNRFTSIEAWLPAGHPARTPEADATADTSPRILAEIDNDGRSRTPYGELPGFEAVDDDAFVPRRRYGLELVEREGRLLIRKDFRGDHTAFARETLALATLDATGEPLPAPSLARAEEGSGVLEKAFVPGPTLRQLLVEAGAKILSVDTEGDPELAGLEGEARLEAVWARGREAFSSLGHGRMPGVPGTPLSTTPSTTEEDLLEGLEGALDAAHRSGVTGFSVTFGNVVLHAETGEPWWIDFDAATCHRRRGSDFGEAFHLARDRDRRIFNRIYGTDLLTESEARRILAEVRTNYSPVDLGRGLATRGFWSTDSGTGRWDYVNGPVMAPLVAGARVLDLGCHNAAMSLLMLRSGAREVVAVERSAETLAAARRLHRLFEWRVMKPLALDLHQADMRAILDTDWGSFDVVTALCSLYYLEPEDMAQVVRRAAELAPMLILQAKTDTRAEAGDNKAEKSTVGFLKSMMESNGFPAVEVHGPAGFSRPILVGRRQGREG